MANLLLMICCGFLDVNDSNKLYSSVVPYVSHDDFYVSKYEEVNDDISINIETESINDDVVDDVFSEDNNEDVYTDESSKLLDIDTEEEQDEEEKNEEKENIEVDDSDELYVKEEDIINDEYVSVEDSLIHEEKIEERVGYYSPNGTYLGENNIKIVDISSHQGDVNWDLFASESDCYGVVLRLGYYETLDKMFERNISELKRLNIPYGIYLYSYSVNKEDAINEAEFTKSMIDKYQIEPTLGIYYDIESWNRNEKKSSSISKDMYDEIITTYINSVSEYVGFKYKVKVYSGRWYAMNKFNDLSKSYVDWVAEYNKTCKYDGSYTMWQYTSKGSVPGIIGNVDISYIL